MAAWRSGGFSHYLLNPQFLPPLRQTARYLLASSAGVPFSAALSRITIYFRDSYFRHLFPFLMRLHRSCLFVYLLQTQPKLSVFVRFRDGGLEQRLIFTTHFHVCCAQCKHSVLSAAVVPNRYVVCSAFIPLVIYIQILPVPM